MANPRKAILIVGLGKYIPDPDRAHKIVTLIETDAALARAVGFDFTICYANPQDPTATVNEVASAMRQQRWDGVVVGFGVRGNKAYTHMFEDLVNTSRELAPDSKMIFSGGPDEVLESLWRHFPDMSRPESS